MTSLKHVSDFEEILVVGNAFYLAEEILPNVKTIKNLTEKILKNARLVLGQGLTRQDILSLKLLDAHILNKGFLHEEKTNVHKKRQENVIITEPIKIEDYKFVNYMFLNGDSGLVDHITGLHIPAIILTEAARQCMLAITERFYIVSAEKLSLRFTISDISSKFLRFCFPMETIINSSITIERYKSENFFYAKIFCEIIQKEKVCSEISIQYACSPERNVLQKEIDLYTSIANV